MIFYSKRIKKSLILVKISVEMIFYHDIRKATYNNYSQRTKMITPTQMRAARAMLNMSQGEVAKSLGIAANTLSNIESGHSDAPASRLKEMQDYYENQGIVFTEQGGVNPNRSDIVRYVGTEGFIAFMKDVLETAKKQEPDICVSNVDERNWQKNIGNFHEKYISERSKLRIQPSRILVKKGDDYWTASQFADYREAPMEAFSENVSFYAYGEKLALIRFGEEVHVLVLKNVDFANGFRTTFNYIWSQAKTP